MAGATISLQEAAELMGRCRSRGQRKVSESGYAKWQKNSLIAHSAISGSSVRLCK